MQGLIPAANCHTMKYVKKNNFNPEPCYYQFSIWGHTNIGTQVIKMPGHRGDSTNNPLTDVGTFPYFVCFQALPFLNEFSAHLKSCLI